VLSGRLQQRDNRPIDVKDLFDAKVVTLRMKHAGVKLLGRGMESFTTPLHIEVQDASVGAIEAIERAGGSIKTVYYSKLTLRAKLKPEKFGVHRTIKNGPSAGVVYPGKLPPRPALPPPRMMRSIYMTERKRGYLRKLKEGDIVQPHEHPEHVDLELADTMPPPKYPQWRLARIQADEGREAIRGARPLADRWKEDK